MSPIQLQEKLKKMSELIKDKNIIDYFPTIINDLEFIIQEYPIELNNLTEEERTDNVYEIEYYKITYLAELIKKYMELTWKKDFSYEIVDGYLFNSTAGYNQRDDIVTISIFGMILNSETNADMIKSLAHEYRHQLQYHFLKEKEFKDILNYPPYFITIIKNLLPKEIKTVINEEGYVIDKPYYYNNYKRIYMEVDANYYGVEVSKSFLSDLYNKYPDKSEKLNSRVKLLEKELALESDLTIEGLEKEKRIDTIYLEETRLKKPITSTVLVDDNEEDSLIYIDKCIKEEPFIEERFPVISILKKDNRFKNYAEIIIDKYKNINKYKDKDRIEEIYSHIIKTDPMLIISKYILEKDIDSIKEFIRIHPTFINEYQDDLNKLFNILIIDQSIINLLTEEEYVIMKKERK
ncbi:MAG: hypothetical protein IJ097_05155 [Bacilli bacterium]|nr:hypothetical protein [Bacilli bacterium]